MRIGLGIGLINKSTTGGAIPPVVSSVTIPTSIVVNTPIAVSYTIVGSTTTITRTWYRGATVIATSTTSDLYTPVQADAGNASNIKCMVTATNAAGSSSADSNTVAQVLTARTGAFLTASAISDATIRGGLNTFDIGLIANSLDTKMKAVYPFVTDAADNNSRALQHRWNFMDARDTNAAFRLSFIGTWTHSSTGALPNGSNAFANTFLNPTTSLTSSLGLSYYSRTNANTGLDQVDIGAITGLNYFYLTTQYNVTGLVNRFFGRCTSSSIAINTPNADARGYYYLGKTGNGTNLFKSFKNGVVQDTQTGAGVNPNNTVYIGAANDSGSTLYYTNRECAFATISDGLTDTDAANLYNLTQQLQTTLGRQV